MLWAINVTSLSFNKTISLNVPKPIYDDIELFQETPEAPEAPNQGEAITMFYWQVSPLIYKTSDFGYNNKSRTVKGKSFSFLISY